MKVRQLTEVQKEQLTGRTYDGVQFFNPTQDGNGNWIISNEEVNQCSLIDGIEFINSLEEIDYVTPIIENPFGV